MSTVSTQNIKDTATVAQDSIVQEFHAAYPGGVILDTMRNNVPITEISDLPQIEMPKGIAGERFADTPEFQSGVMLLILISFLLVSFSFGRGAVYISELLRNPFSVKERDNMFEDKTVKDTFMLSTLILNTMIIQGIIVYYVCDYFNLISDWDSHEIVPVLIFVGMSAVLIIFQYIMYNVLGYVFSIPEKTKIWTTGFLASQALLGVVLIPIALMLNIHALTLTSVLTLGVILFILLRLLFIIKGFRIFFNKIPYYVYFILYLCTLEIVPIVLSIVGAILICNTLQI